MRMAKRLVCLPLGASPLLLSMYHKPGSARFAVTEGLDAEADAVGPGIYGGRVERDESGAVVIGQQFELGVVSCMVQLACPWAATLCGL